MLCCIEEPFWKSSDDSKSPNGVDLSEGCSKYEGRQQGFGAASATSGSLRTHSNYDL